LIKWIEKIDFDEDKIFIKDENKKIFVFDSQGRFLNTIGRIGDGPDEQLSMRTFYLDKEKKQIYVCDILKSKMFIYSYSGELLKYQNIDKIFNRASSLTLTNDSHLLLALDNDNGSLYNYCMTDCSEYKKINDLIPYIAVGNMSVSFALLPKITKSKETVYMSAFMSDTIYKYDEATKNVIPEWVFQGKYRPMKKADLGGQTFELALDVISIAKAKKLSTGIDELYSTGKYIHFTFRMDNNRYRVFWDLQNQQGWYYNAFFDTADVFTSLEHLIAATEDAFVCFLEADEALLQGYGEDMELKKILDNTVEDDNPILAFYYLE
jgi:hypothetical protein